ncbi:hypothetical protein TNCV_354511 [Trichonephila clavipes]|uniref:Uncharacterized protein n=2 Tax=Trichonephila clavipes TaxID=2585209 RepID=A0A8X6W0T8_TRICX|nr:hypothetical protein TNCV_354511 [Trichonephila clavipes]
MNYLSDIFLFISFALCESLPVKDYQNDGRLLQRNPLRGAYWVRAGFVTQYGDEMPPNARHSALTESELVSFCQLSDDLPNSPDCPFIVEETFYPHRIPQWISNITCISESSVFSEEERATQCEQVSTEVAVLKKTSHSKGLEIFNQAWENINVACIRTIPGSDIESQPGHSISLKRVPETDASMNYLSGVFLFISFALCESLPVPDYKNEGRLVQRNPLRGAYWIRAGFVTQYGDEMPPNARHSALTESELVSFCQLSDDLPNSPDCPFIVEETFYPHRIPQWISNITCISESSVFSEEERATQCEQVSTEVAVLKKTSHSKGLEIFNQAWENVNVACIRTVPGSDIESQPGHSISLKRVPETDASMNYLSGVFLFISFALCESLPVPDYKNEGRLVQRNPFRGAYWIRAGFVKQYGDEMPPNARHSALTESELVSFCQLSDVLPTIPDCPFIVEETFDPHRIPQWISNITCISESSVFSEEERATQCEQVSTEIAVLKKTSHSKGLEIFNQAWENVNVACIRTVPGSDIESQPGHSISLKRVPETDASMNYLSGVFLFISFALCESLPVPDYKNEGRLVQRNPLRGAYWIRAGFVTQYGDEMPPNARHSALTESELVSFCQLSDVLPTIPDCPFIVEETFDPHRIPQWISNITCISESSVFSEEERATQCEQVSTEIAVLKKTSHSKGLEIFNQAWENVNVACIRTVPGSDIESQPGHSISLSM